MPATSIFINAASAGMSGIGYSRISVLLGPTRTAASTLSATETPPMIDGGQSRTGPGPVKVIFTSPRGDGQARRQVLVMAGGPASALLDAMPGSLDAALLREASRTPASARPREGVDARALQACRRRADSGQ